MSTSGMLERPPDSSLRRPTGLSETEAAAILAERGRYRAPRTSRSYASIVRANVLTVFNAILAAFGVMTLLFGDARDFTAALLIDPVRRLFALAVPTPGMIVTALLAGLMAIGALALAGYLPSPGEPSPENRAR